MLKLFTNISEDAFPVPDTRDKCCYTSGRSAEVCNQRDTDELRTSVTSR